MVDTPGERPLAAAPAGRLQVFSVFRYREYRLFWIGAAFSNLGVWALMAGRLWLMHDLTESPLMLGLLTLAGSGPILVLSMWGGVLADRVNRLRLVTFTRAMFAVMAILTGVLVATDVVQPWHLIVISLATGVLFSFDIPSRQAILPNLVDRSDLLKAIVLYSMIFGSAAVIGPSLFAPMVNLVGMEGLFFYVGGAYVLTVLTLLMMKPIPSSRADRESRLWEDLVAGLSYIRGHRAVMGLIGIGLVTGIFGSAYGTLMPVFADNVLGGGVENYSLLLLASGAGGLAGTMSLGVFGNLKNSVALQLLTGVGFGLALAIFSRITWLPASIVAVGVVGASSSAFGTINNTLLQSIVADEYRGRVMSIHQVGWGASAVGGLLMGFLAQSVSASFALTLSGLVTAAATAALTVYAARGIRTRSAEPASSLAGEAGTTSDD